ncbi:unnamed protein product [Mytilus coruscus]|uniref:G-protein coupled receptors family 1 profile domain-containing protein n=1 Tax=Mytilus coruscus TaxID=42192 RepID=A0A6J8CD75_MYTCO|nr:unnamed protein product [Mytilus coruscus]
MYLLEEKPVADFRLEVKIEVHFERQKGMFSNITVQDLEEDNFQKDGIGVTIFLSLLCVVGVFGNAHAFLIYTFRFKPTNCRVFVQWLSSVDIAIITSQIKSRFSTRLQTNLAKSNNDQKDKTRDKTEKPNDSLNYSRDISFLFIAASTMSYVGYLLTVISFLIDFINPDTTGSFKSMSAIMYRGFFISSAGNPVVYLFLDRQFRVECKNVYSKLFGKCCWSKEITITV